MLYLATTADDLELPVAVADSQRELGKMIKVDCADICRGIKRPAKKPWKYKFFAVEEESE